MGLFGWLSDHRQRFEDLAKFFTVAGVAIGVLSWVVETPDRKVERILGMWQVVHSATASRAHGGRIAALEALAAEGESFVGLELAKQS